MNKVYRVIWNESLGAWVAVSEITKSKGKKSNKAIKSGVLVSSLVLFAGNAIAASYNAGGGTAGSDAIAIGQSANASGVFSIALGEDSVAKGLHTVALGKDAQAIGDDGVAVGTRAEAIAKYSTALGNESNAKGEYALAVGYRSKASGEQSTAVGFGSQSTGKASNAIGGSSLAAGEYSTAVGQESKAIADFTLAAGYNTIASGEQSTAVGFNSNSTGYGSNAIGSSSLAKGAHSTAIGTSSAAEGDHSIAIGQGSKTAAGEKFATALGFGSNASGWSSFAQGYSAEAIGGGSIAMGDASKAADNDTIAIGTRAQATGSNSISIGKGNTVSGKNSAAIGNPSTISGNDSYSLGNNNTIATNDTFVVGNNVTKTLDNSVFLGKDAAYTAKGAYTDGVGKVSDAKVGGITYAGASFAGQTPVGVVSVGDDGKERRIQNMAAGLISEKSTDAINGSQLYATNEVLGNVANSTKNILGGNATLNPNGTLTMTNIGNTGKNTIHDAIQAATTKVEEGAGIKVDPTKNADGSTTYKVAAKTDGTTTKIDGNGNIAAVTTTFTSSTDGKVGAPVGNGDSLVTANTVANAINNSGWKLAADGTTGTELINPSDIVTFKTDSSNLTVKRNGANIAYDLAKDININSVQFNDGPKITNDGNNIKIGDKDGNATKITNVKAGTGDNDAVNVSQLKDAQSAATTKVEEGAGIKVDPTKNADGSTTYKVAAKTDGTTTKIDGNGNIAAVTTTFTSSTDGKVGAPVGNGDSLVTANTVANAINNSGWKLAADGTTGTELINPSDIVTFKTDSSNLTVKRNGANIAYDLAKDININSVQFNDGPKITNDGNNIKIGDKDGNATKITNVKAGTGDNDAVNVSQLKDAQSAATTKVEEGAGIKVDPTKNADGSTTYKVAAKTDGTTTKIDGNGNIAAVTTTFTSSTDGKVGAPVGNGDSLVTANTVANAINNSGWKLAADGTTGTELINPSDIVTFKTDSSNLTVKRNGANIAYDLAKDININSVQFNDGPKITNDGNNIKIGDKDGNATKITNVKAGTGDNDAVNVSQLKDAQSAATTKVEEGAGIKVDPTKNADGSTTYKVAAKTDGTTTKIDGNGNIAAVTTTFTSSTDGKVGAPVGNGDSLVTANTVANAINNSGWKLAADGTTGTELINPSDIVTFKTDSSNLTVKRNGANIAYDLAKDININSVQFNDGPKITNDGNNIKIGDKDGNATKITNVKAGTGDNDAVNVSQLKDAQSAATTKVEEGAGIKVDPTKNADGSTTYKVAAKTDGTTTKIDGNGNIAAVTTTFTSSTDGKVGAPVGNGDSLVTANTVANAINNSGWKLAADGTTGTELINPSDIVTFKTDSSNLTVKRNGANIAYDLAKDININSVQFNDGPKITNDGNNIKIGDKDGNATKITNVKAGTGDNDAVNVSQLKDAQSAATTKVEEGAGIKVDPTKNADGSTTYKVAAKTDGTTTKIDGNGNIAAVTTTFTSSTDGKVGAPVGNGDSLVTANTVANAINNSGWKLAADGTTGTELINPSDIVTFKTDSSNLTVKRNGANIAYDLAKDININSVQFNDGPKITNDGNNIKIGDKDGNATKITNVKAGTGDNDAVNVSQLKDAQSAATTKVEEGAGIKVDPTKNADGSTTYKVAAKTDGTTTKIDGNGNIAAVTTTFTSSTDGKVGAPVGNGDSLVTANTVANAINNSGWKLAADGTTGTELINPSDIVTFKTDSSNLTVKRNGANIAYDLAKDININSVQFNDGPKITNDGNNIKIGDKDGNATKITNVKAGTGDNDAVNVSQLKDAQSAATTKVEEGAGIKVDPTKNADGSTTYKVAAKTDGTTTKIDGNGNIAAVTTTFTSSTDGKVGAPVGNGDSLVTANTVANAINNSGWKLAADGTTGTELINPSDIVTFKTDSSNLTVKRNGANIAYDLAKDININSVQFNDGPKITNDGNNIKIGDKDGNATKITNVKAGTGDNDAVNVSQLKDAQSAATTKVEEGAGIKVDPTKNADGSTTYKVAAKTDGTTTKIDGNGNIAAVTTTFTSSTDGKVGAPVGNGDSLVTANTVANAINNSGWKLAADGTTGTELINPSDIVTFKTDSSNLTVKRNGANIAYDLAKDININSVQFNDGPKITNDGNNIKIGDKDGNATKITNVKAGTGDNDAVNVSQLKDAQSAATTKVEEGAGIKVDPTKNADGSTTYKVAAKTDGTTTKIDGNGNIAAVTTTFTSSTDGKVGAPVGNGDSLVTANTVANAINNSGWKLAADGTTGTELINPSDIVTFKTDSSNLTVKRNGANIAYDLAKDININSVQFNDGPKITNDGNNIKIGDKDGNATKITNVKAGTGDNDAVNVSQLKDAQSAATTKVEEGAGIKVDPTKNADGSTTYKVAAKTDGTTTKIDGNGNIAAVTTTFTSSTDGKVGAPVGNGDSLVTANTVANAINNSGWKLAADGTTGTELINPSDIVTFKTDSSNLTVKRNGANIAYDLAKDININSVQFNDGPKITNDGNNIKIGDKDGNATKITNVKAGTGDNDAVNVSQLKDAQSAATTKVEEGAGIKVDPTKNADGSTTYKVAAKTDGTTTKIDGNGNIAAVTTTFTSSTDGKVGAPVGNGDSLVTANTVANAINNSGWKLAADGTTGTELINPSDIVTFKTDSSNLTVKRNGANIAYDLAKDININSVQFNDGPKITNDGNNIKIGDKDGNATKITNVKAGTGDNDAVNVSQLKDAQSAATTKVEEGAGIKVDPTKNADGSTTYKVAAKTDGTTTKIDGNGNIAAVTTTFTSSTDGKVGAPVGNGDSLVTANTVANAINNSGWKLAADGTTGTELINPSDIVTFKTDSSNLTVKRNGANIAYDLAKDININSVQFNDGPKITNDGNNIKIGDKDGNATKITNVKAGTGDNDAVNVSQLKDAQSAATTKVEEGAGIKVDPTKNADGSTTYKVAAKTDGTTTKIDGNGNIAAVTTTFTSSTDGKVGAPVGNGDSLVTANTVANAINNSGWKLAADGTTGTELINPSDIVTFKTDSSNLTVKRNGANIAYDLAKDININSVQFNDGPKITNDGNNIKIGDKDGNATKITNVKAGTGDNDAVNVSQLKDAQSAATTKVEEGAGIKVDPTKNADGSTTYKVAAKTDGTTTKIDGNGNIAAVTTTFTSSTDGKVGAPVGNGDSLVTANTVANAINNSGWKLAADGTTGTELINPSDIVTFKTDSSNLTVKRNGANIAYDLAKDININSVQFNDGPKITNDGNNIKIGDKDGNATKITNVKAGTGDNDAVNVSQLKDAQSAATTKVEEGAGIKVDPTKNADGSTTYKVAAKTDGTTTKIDGNGNIAAVTTTFTSSTDGKVGAPVGNGDSLVTANTVANAINNSGWKLAADGTTGTELINPSDIVTFKTDSSNLTVKRNGANIAYDLAKDININSVQFNDGPKITNDGNNIKIGDKDGNATKITNVKAGTGDNDAVNVSQLKDAQSAATTKVEEGAGIKVDPTKNADGSTTYKVAAKTDGTTTKIDGNGNIAAVTTTFTSSTDGKVGAPVGNGDSLVTANTVANAINNSGWKLAADGTTGTELINPSDIVTFKTDSSNLTVKRNGANIAYDLAKDININSVQFNDGPKITNDGNNIKIGDKDGNATKITNVKAGTGDNDAVNVSQLKAVEATANKGWNLTTNGKPESKSNVKPGDTVDFANEDGNVKIENKGNNVIVNLNKDIDLTKDGSVTIGDTKVNNDGLTIAGGPSVTKSGIDAGDKKITNVAPGKISADSKDAINGSQLYTVQQAAVAAKTEVKAGDNVEVKKESGGNGQDIYTVSAKDTSASVTAGSDAITVNKADPKKVVTVDVTDYKVDLSQATKDNIQKGVDAKGIVDNKGLTFAGDNNSSTEVQKLGSTVNVKGDKNITTQASGNTVKVTLNPNVTVESLTATNSVNVGSGNAQVALTTNVGKDDVRELSVGSANAPTRITNVARGVNNTDAVNLSQLKDLGYNINTKIDKVEKEANAGIASAMAMETAPFIAGKWTYAVGAAYHGGEQAVGATLRKTADNGRWSLTGGVATGTEGDTSVRIGISGVID